MEHKFLKDLVDMFLQTTDLEKQSKLNDAVGGYMV